MVASLHQHKRQIAAHLLLPRARRREAPAKRLPALVVKNQVQAFHRLGLPVGLPGDLPQVLAPVACVRVYLCEFCVREVQACRRLALPDCGPESPRHPPFATGASLNHFQVLQVTPQVTPQQHKEKQRHPPVVTGDAAGRPAEGASCVIVAR